MGCWRRRGWSCRGLGEGVERGEDGGGWMKRGYGSGNAGHVTNPSVCGNCADVNT
jgi:hypothetical protein